MKKVACEIGVNLPELSQILKDAPEYDELILVEPEPFCFKKIQNYVASHYLKTKIRLFNVAITDSNDGFVSMIQTKPECQSTSLYYIDKSPILKRYKHQDLQNIKVQSLKMNDIDNGKITHLFIDAEGAEWFVLKNLISRPQMIKLEMGNPNHPIKYANPFMKEILQWFKDNNYKFEKHIDSDMIFIKQ
jgi:FkbM family methyltransferase